MEWRDLADISFRLIVIPLSFLRKLDSLKYTSVIALVSIAYLVVLVVYHFSAGDTLSERGEVHVIKWQGAIPTLASFPVIVFAYTCHQNVSQGVTFQIVIIC
jgi:amino acid permease